MDSRTYWKQREAEQLKHYITEEAEYQKHINGIYDYMMAQIQKEINGFYVKYAKKEGITLSEAKKRVSKLDIEEYGRKAAKYVKEKDFSKEANDEMRLYNATMKINRLELLKANVGLELVDGFNELQKYYGQILTDRSLDEFRHQAGILGNNIQNNDKAAHAIVNASFHNAKYSDRIWMYQDMMKAELDKLLRQGLIQGKHPRELSRHLAKLFGVSKYNAERLMRTELARVQIEAQMQSFERNGYEEYQFLALETACETCRKLDGKHFKIKDMQIAENAPPMHPNCRCSTAAYMDDEEFDKWLESRDKGDIIEPEKKTNLTDELKYTPKELREKSLQVNKYLNLLGLPRSKWSGRTFVKSMSDMPGFTGVKKKVCDIWLREDAEMKTVIHEHLHARSSSWVEKKLKKDRGFEEGACELLAEEICKQNKISYKPTYKEYVQPLRRFNKLLGEYNSDYEFAIELFKIDMDKREEWLNEMSNKQGMIKALVLKCQIRMVRNGK